MSSLPPELADPLEQLRAALLKINDSEQACMTNAVASASHGKHLPEIQAIMARCRQSAAAAVATAIDTFRHDCYGISARATSLTELGIVAATATSVWDFWTKSESCAAAFASEAAADLPAHGPDKTTQTITASCSERASSINRYFAQLTT